MSTIKASAMNLLRTPWWPALVSLVAAVALLPQDASAAREQRATPDFQAIVSHGSFDLQVRQADRTSVELEGDEAVLAQIETVVEPGEGGQVLQIRMKGAQRWSGGWGKDKSPVVRIALPRLSGVSLRGSGDLKLEPFTTPELKIAVTGAGDVQMRQLSAERLTVGISGSGDVRGDGKVDQLKLSIAGSGDARLRGMIAQKTEVSIAGSGDAEVHAETSLAISVAGSGDVRHAGAAVPRSRIAGSGSVQRLP